MARARVCAPHTLASARALQRLFRADVRAAAGSTDVVGRLISTLPADFVRWPALCQDQFLEVKTLLGGYLLSSQGDRMLMAHSVEGRFPFLDTNVVELANSLPPAYLLRSLDEKHVLKRAAEGIVPETVVRRKKQPYRAPDALAFVDRDAPDWVGEVMSESAVADAGVFEPRAVTQLWSKCRAAAGAGQFSNADNMAVVGVLSTGILHRALIRETGSNQEALPFKTLVDRWPGAPIDSLDSPTMAARP